jgi:hypothetical protein
VQVKEGGESEGSAVIAEIGVENNAMRKQAHFLLVFNHKKT